MLWLAIRLPRLPAEIFLRTGAAREPFVVAEGSGGQRVVAAAGPGAAARGILAGMTLGAAAALAPDLFAVDRDEAGEAAALARVAAWAGRFSPAVCLLSPNEAALEVGRSARLFGGIDRLLETAAEGLREMGYTTQSAAAPTPLGAALLARARPGALAASLEELASALCALPVGALDLPPETRDALRGLGIARIGELREMPRGGLSRRLGEGLLQTLDRAFGARPDPREPFEPPPRFFGRLALPAEALAAEPLLFAARRLLLEAQGYLEARGTGAGGLALTLVHRDAPPTRVEVGLLAPARDPARLLLLLRERLERATIPAPVSAVELSVEKVVPLSPGSRELWKGAARDAAESWPELVERLRSRLGPAAVAALRAAPEHRPERASVPAGLPAPAESALPARFGPRPLWLLPRPAPLARDAVTLLAGPERIESGWWDGDDVRRDYFVAEDRQGARLWVFRERGGNGRWYLHGIFA